MELNIEEYPESQIFEKVPENNNILLPKPKLIRQTNNTQSIPKQYARQVRPKKIIPKPNVSYDDILNKMGMFVKDGRLHLLEDNNQSKSINNLSNQSKSINNLSNQSNQNIPQNSYIYNKYFKNELQQENEVKVPQTVKEYKLMLIQDIIQKERIRRMKSTKLIIPNPNITTSIRNNSNLNKLFSFPQK
jgi:hypothetical protein